MPFVNTFMTSTNIQASQKSVFLKKTKKATFFFKYFLEGLNLFSLNAA